METVILAAPRQEIKLLMENAEKIDDAFMSVLVARMNEAEQKEDIPQFQALNEIHSLIYAQMERTLPPHVQLYSTNWCAQNRQRSRCSLLDENGRLFVNDELLQLIDQVMDTSR